MANNYGNSTGYTVQMAGPFGNKGSSEKTEQISLLAAEWKNAVSPFFQTVEVQGISESSKVDIQAAKEQIQKLCADGTAIHIENENGITTAWAIGRKPEEDMVFQVTLTEVVTHDHSIIKGNSVGYPREDLNMHNGKISNLADPLNEADAANKAYVDAQIAVAKKYTDDKHFFRDVTLTVENWSADAPYKQTVIVAGITENDRPVYGLVLSADAATAIAEKEAYAMVDDLDTDAGAVTFTCLEEKPEVALNIQMEVNR
jgi:hypothetical protein